MFPAFQAARAGISMDQPSNMAVSNASNSPESRVQYWRRVLRPLSWWLLLVLVLYGIRLHQRWSAQTHLKFRSAVAGHPSLQEVDAKLDGQPLFSGQRVRIGWHRLLLSHPDGYPVVTNLFIWYGERNLGKITLERTKGTLVVSAEPKAERLTIRGPEFSIVLTNGEGYNARVPTDQYTVEAVYKYWRDSKTVTVFTDNVTSHRFAPKLGTLTLNASHSDISFELRNDKGVYVESGSLPVTIAGLPEGNGYRLNTDRKQDQRVTPLAVKAGTTNEYRVEYVYGSVSIESTPSGAAVINDGQEIGVTPLTLPEVKPGSFDFTLQLNEYEPATGAFVVEADQTNSYRTNLISVHFTRAIGAARRYYQNMAYDRAVEAASEALKYKPDDVEAANLVTEASIQGHLARAENLALRNDFTNAIAEANLALTLAPDNPRGKAMVADYTSREQQRLEAIRKREEELAEQARLRRARELMEQQARQRTQELRGIFRAYP